MKIITISREFGSGGRELGKTLASLTGFSYYDSEILTAIAAKKGLNEHYVGDALDRCDYRNIPLHIGRSFSIPSSTSPKVELLLEEKSIIEEIARVGKDCIIVGRNADVILQEYNPLCLFVCAQMDAKIKRCVERANPGEHLSPREILRQIKRIDSARKETRHILTNSEWGDPKAYHLVINTTDWCISDLAPSIADFAENFFRRTNK